MTNRLQHVMCATVDRSRTIRNDTFVEMVRVACNFVSVNK